MTTHKLDRKIDHTWLIDDDRDSWILGRKGRIDVINMDGIFAAATIHAATIRIDGAIAIDPNGDAQPGLNLFARKAILTIGETGRVSSNAATIHYNNYKGAVTIDNAGLLQGQTGIYVTAAQDRTAIGNTGRIDGNTGNGILAVGAGAAIVNSGAIKAGYGIQAVSGIGDVDFLDAERATHITNSGKVTGLSYSIYTGNGFDVAVNLRNKGTLNGDVWLADGEDVVDNRGGTINGDVKLGVNNDRFDGRGGRLNGVLYGGDGDDIVTLASPATLYVELAGEGYDQVRINATYRLGANIEALVLLGKASHTGIGNSLGNILAGNRGANALYGLDGNDQLLGLQGRDRLDGGDGTDVLDGGKGNDRLLGGANNDVFVFNPGSGHDQIMDFEPGIDSVKLYDFDGLASFDDLKMWTSPSGDVVIRLNDTDRLVLRDTDISALTLNDFVF